MESVPPPGAWERVAFKGENIEFNLATCNQHDRDPDEEQQIDESLEVASDAGVLPGLSNPRAYRDLITEVQVDGIGEDHQLPVPARMPETYNLDEWMDADEALVSAEEERYAAANPVTRLPMDELYRRQASKLEVSQGEFGITPASLMTINPKLKKSEGYGWLDLGLMLAPNVMAGLGDLCPFRSKGCTALCLNDSGQGEQFKGTGRGIVQQAFRKRRTLFFYNNRDAFMSTLDRSLANTQTQIFQRERDMRICVRMNVLSDIPWESIKYPGGDGRSVMEMYPNIPFYDYTKNTSRMYNFLKNKDQWPSNYHLTFSWSEINAAFCFWVLDNGGNIALPFDTPANKDGTPADKWKKLPYYFAGYKVIDADMTDLRFLDAKFFTNPQMVTAESAMKGQLDRNIIKDVKRELSEGRGLICGLRLKGQKARKGHAEGKQRERAEGRPLGTYTSGFVMYADEEESSNQDPEMYIEMLVNASEQRRAQQMAEKTDVAYPGDLRRKPFMGIAPKEEAMLLQEGRIGASLMRHGEV